MTLPGTSLTVVNETEIRGHAMQALIEKYSAVKTLYGFRPIGAEPAMTFPVIMVQPKKAAATMRGTAKYDLFWTFGLYWFVRESRVESANQVATQIGETLIKLFSNNALGVPGDSPANTFKSYSGYWLDSEIQDVAWSVPYVNPDVRGTNFEQAGRMLIQIYDLILK